MFDPNPRFLKKTYLKKILKKIFVAAYLSYLNTKREIVIIIPKISILSEYAYGKLKTHAVGLFFKCDLDLEL